MKIIDGDLFQKDYIKKKKKRDILTISLYLLIITISTISLFSDKVSFVNIFLRAILAFFYLQIVNELRNIGKLYSLESLFALLLFSTLLIHPESIVQIFFVLCSIYLMFQGINLFMLSNNVLVLLIYLIIALFVLLKFKLLLLISNIMLPIFVILFSVSRLIKILRK